MALKAGYKGVKQNILYRLIEMLGNVSIKSISEPLELSDDGELSLELVVDDTPTENSENLVTSGGVYEALQNTGGGGCDLLYDSPITAPTTITLLESYNDYDILLIDARASGGGEVTWLDTIINVKRLLALNPNDQYETVATVFSSTSYIRCRQGSNTNEIQITARTGEYYPYRIYGIKF